MKSAANDLPPLVDGTPDHEGALRCHQCFRRKYDAVTSADECGHCGPTEWVPEAPVSSDEVARIVGVRISQRLMADFYRWVDEADDEENAIWGFDDGA